MSVKQGVKIVSPRAELTALRGLCHKDPRITGTLLSSLDESYFYSDESVELFNYLRTQITLEGKPIKYKLLLEDPSLSKEARSYIRDSEAIINDLNDAKHSVKLLTRYRKRRGLYSIANSINEALMASKIDEDDVLHKVARSLGKVQRSKGSEDDFLHFGVKGNSHDFVKDLVYNKPEDAFIPTGIEAFDEVNVGLIRSSLVTIAGNSGSGKSHVAAALAKNMATAGYKVTVTPLEMSKREMTCRIIANVAQVDSLKLMAGSLTKNEKEHVWTKYMRWYKRMERRGGRYSVYKPPEDVTIYELFAVLDTYGADVNIVDYISLLAGVDGDDQWKQLGAVARFSKIHAETHNCVNILLAQLSDEGKIKYSRAITEHSTNSWIFKADADTKELGILKVDQPKSRNQVSFPFTLKISYSTSTIQSIRDGNQRPGNDSSESVPNLAAEVE